MNLPGYSGSSDLHLAKLAATDSTLHFHTCPQNLQVFPSKPQLLPLKSPAFASMIFTFAFKTSTSESKTFTFALKTLWPSPLPQTMSCEKNSHDNALVLLLKCSEENLEQVEALKQAHLWGRLNFRCSFSIDISETSKFSGRLHFSWKYLKQTNFSVRPHFSCRSPRCSFSKDLYCHISCWYISSS